MLEKSGNIYPDIFVAENIKLYVYIQWTVGCWRLAESTSNTHSTRQKFSLNDHTHSENIRNIYTKNVNFEEFFAKFVAREREGK